MDFLSYSPQLQRALEALGLSLLHSFWQGLVLMILLWVLLRLIRQDKANLRFGLALAALFLLMTAFAGTIYYEWESLEPVAVIAQEVVSLDLPLTEYTVSQVEPTLWQQVQREANALFFQLSENAVWMAGLWLLGSLFFSARLGLGLWQVRQLRQQREPFPEHWQQIATNLQQKLGVRRKVSFSGSEQVESPLTLGWLRPVILLPSAMLMAMPADQLESILVHELAHIRRHDYLWNLLQSLAEVVFFYHPAYWYMASVLEQEREMACDAITLQVTGRPQVYAQALLQVASLRTTFSPVALSARGSTKGRSGFAERIKRIVIPDYQKKSVQPLPFLLSFCLIGMLLFAFTLKESSTNVQQAHELTQSDTSQYKPYIKIDNGFIQMGDIEKIPSTGIYKESEIDYAPSVEEILLQISGITPDTENLNVEKLYEQKISIDESLNSDFRFFRGVEGLSGQEVNVNFSAPNVLYLLDGVAVNPKKVTRYEVRSMQVFPSHSVEGVDTSRYKLVVKAKSRGKVLPKSQEKVSPGAQKTNGKAIQNSIPPPDSSIYDVMVNKVFINVKGQNARITKNDQEASGIKNSEIRTYYHIGDPEVLFTLDGVVTDPRTVKRSEVENASFENENVPDGYLIEFKAISKKAAEAARLKEKKTIVSGIIKDQKTGDPLPGTNIRIKGTENATISDLQGRYQIELPKGKGELLYSYIGYQSRTELIQNSKILDIGMFTEGELPGEENMKAVMVSGKIVDAQTGKPLPGTNILIKGTSTGTVSNWEGEYSLQVPEGGEELLFVHIGYEEEVVSIVEQGAIDVSLSPLSAEAKQKRIEELEKKRAERISRQLPALSSLDSTLVIVNGQARKEVKSLSELNIQPDEILAINVMGTEADLSQYLDASEQGQYKKVVRIITKKGAVAFKQETVKEPSPNPLTSPSQKDSILFIVDKHPVEPFDAKEIEPSNIKRIDVKKGSSAAQFMTPSQQEKYNAVVMITTKESSAPEKATPEKTFTVFPNPGNDEVKVRFNLKEAGPLEFELLDKEGGFLKSIKQDFSSAGNQEISIPVDELPADTYFLRVKLNGQYETRRVIIQ